MSGFRKGDRVRVAFDWPHRAAIWTGTVTATPLPGKMAVCVLKDGLRPGSRGYIGLQFVEKLEEK